MSVSTVVIIPEEGEGSKIILDTNIAKESVTLKNMLEDLNAEEAIIPLPGTPQDALVNVFRYVKMQLDNPPPVKEKKPGAEEEIPVRSPELDAPWKHQFFTELDTKDRGLIFQFITAANYLDIKYALEDCSKFIASLIKGKSPEEIRKAFALPEGKKV